MNYTKKKSSYRIDGVCHSIIIYKKINRFERKIKKIKIIEK